MKKLEGKVAIITGGASGMGRASALLFGEEGAKVVIADINDSQAEETVRLGKEKNAEIHYVRTDTSKVSDLENMLKETIDTFGKLNIFWHNAGDVGPGIVERTTEESFDKTMAIHVKGGLFGAKFSIPWIKKEGGGSLLFTSSPVGLRPSKLSPTYSMAKASLAMLARHFAVYCAEDNIRSNCIVPGPIKTPLFPSFFTRDSDIIPPEIARAKTLDIVPMKRYGEPEEIAKAALFLVSDDASYVTGLMMCVDGGNCCA